MADVVERMGHLADLIDGGLRVDHAAYRASPLLREACREIVSLRARLTQAGAGGGVVEVREEIKAARTLLAGGDPLAAWQILDRLIIDLATPPAPPVPTASVEAVARARQALEPFAKIAGPIKGEIGRISYLEAIVGRHGTDELSLSCPVSESGHSEILWADDFRRAAEVLASLTPAPPPVSEAGERGWLVELKGATPSWAILNPRDYDEHWTTDSTKAIRFAREADAQAYIDHIGWTEAFPSEHIWDDGRKARPVAAPTVQPAASVEVDTLGECCDGYEAQIAVLQQVISDRDATIASLTAPTQGDGGDCKLAGRPLTEEELSAVYAGPQADEAISLIFGEQGGMTIGEVRARVRAMLLTPSAPVSAPSPAGGVREALAEKCMRAADALEDNYGGIAFEDAKFGKFTSGSLLREAAEALTPEVIWNPPRPDVEPPPRTVATPEPVSAPAGEVVEAEEPRKVTKLNHFGVKNSADMWRTFNGAHYGHWTSEFDAEMVKRYRAAGVRCRVAAGEMFVHHEDTALAEKVYTALSNAPGQEAES